MPPARRRRLLLKRACLWTATALLLMASYLGSWFGMQWLYGRGSVGVTTIERFRTTIFAPVVLYLGYELPGHELVMRASLWCQLKGAGNDVNWHEVQWPPSPPPSSNPRVIPQSQ